MKINNQAQVLKIPHAQGKIYLASTERQVQDLSLQIEKAGLFSTIIANQKPSPTLAKTCIPAKFCQAGIKWFLCYHLFALLCS
jgi:hypothetical protein